MSEAGHQGMNLGKNADGRLRFSIDANTAVLDDDLRRIAPGSDTVGMLGAQRPPAARLLEGPGEDGDARS